jgi:hypothetical protein
VTTLHGYAGSVLRLDMIELVAVAAARVDNVPKPVPSMATISAPVAVTDVTVGAL